MLPARNLAKAPIVSKISIKPTHCRENVRSCSRSVPWTGCHQNASFHVTPRQFGPGQVRCCNVGSARRRAPAEALSFAALRDVVSLTRSMPRDGAIAVPQCHRIATMLTAGMAKFSLDFKRRDREVLVACKAPRRRFMPPSCMCQAAIGARHVQPGCSGRLTMRRGTHHAGVSHPACASP